MNIYQLIVKIMASLAANPMSQYNKLILVDVNEIIFQL